MDFERLGPYEIGKRIGKGGMGAVYEAVHETTKERVAIKALSPHLANVDGFRERFEAEIESLKILTHEGIVRLYGYGEDDGVLFYSMELVDGASLEEELHAGRRFDWRETLSFGIQICRALKHAHDHGVVHRDIKPANLLLTPDERIKIADFGIARLFGSTQLTTAGGVLGTADYMSPEQADGRSVTDKCDQYSLGCVMYALLAGRPPFRARTMPEMLQMQRFAEPEPVRRYAPAAPRQLEQLITQLLAKDPEARFPNVLVLSRLMEAMQKALSRPVAEAPAEDLTLGLGRASLDATTGGGLANDITLGAEDVSLIPLDTSDSDVSNAPTRAEYPSDAGPVLPAAAPPADVVERPNRFTTVDDEVRRRQHAQQTSRDRWSGWLQLLGLTAALVGLATWGWYLSRPATADELWDEVQQAVAADPEDGLRQVASQLEEFQSRFPADPRADAVEEYLDRLDLIVRARQLKARSLRPNRRERSPAEAIYAEAVRSEPVNPARARRLLEQLLALYGEPVADEPDQDAGTPRPHADSPAADSPAADSPAADPPAADPGDASPDGVDPLAPSLALARQHLEKLREADARAAQAQLPELQSRLDAAQAWEADRPHRAAAVYRALIDLYRSQRWAEAVVAEARRRLTLLDPEP
jgi:serine/threonine-protein kinase